MKHHNSFVKKVMAAGMSLALTLPIAFPNWAAVVAEPYCSLDVDGNGQFDALTDGLLTIRYAFGFSGPALTSGAVALDCTRCTEQAITSCLDLMRNAPTGVNAE